MPSERWLFKKVPLLQISTFDINPCSLIQMEWSYFWSQWFTGSSPWTVMLCRVLTFYQILFYTFTCTSGMYYWCCFMVCTQVQFLLEYFIPLWMVLFWLAISTNTIQQYMYIARGVIFFHHQHRQQECSCELLIELVSSPLCNETPARVSSLTCMKTVEHLVQHFLCVLNYFPKYSRVPTILDCKSNNCYMYVAK